jgi:hypothetical protein
VVVDVPLGLGIGDMAEAVRERVEVSGHHDSWQITAGSFEAALDYARERFDEPIVLARRDRDRLWPRVTLEVTTDPALAGQAPPLAELAHPPAPPAPPAPPEPVAEPEPAYLPTAPDEDSDMPPDLEAIFAHQDEPARRTHRLPRQRRAPR